jgi:hypothetical protein
MQINITIVLAPPYPASCIRHCPRLVHLSRDIREDDAGFSSADPGAILTHYIKSGFLKTARDSLHESVSRQRSCLRVLTRGFSRFAQKLSIFS